MKSILKSRYSVLAVHTCMWIVYIFFNYFLYLIEENYAPFHIYFSKYIISAITFYGMSFGIKRAILDRKWFFLGLAIVLTYTSEFFLRIFIGVILNPWLKGQPISLKEIDVVFTATGSLWWWFQFTMFAVAYSISKILVLKEKEKNRIILEKKQKEAENLILQQQKSLLQQANLQLEKKQIELENAYLRAQINPHFLHNTLNFFFSKSLNAGAYDLGEAIMVLSDVMRFSLEAKPDENGRVPVAQELAHLRNVIKMNEIRFTKTYYLQYQVEGDAENAKIIPLILITMVENAFKYGEWFDSENPVKIQIAIHDHHFRFYLHNKKRFGGAKEPSHGIGVSNSVKRLQAAYGQDGYSINIQDDADYYSVEFTIADLSRIEQPAVNPIPESTPVTA
jgi:two-component system, LytTR family, sensor kinase